MLQNWNFEPHRLKTSSENKELSEILQTFKCETLPTLLPSCTNPECNILVFTYSLCLKAVD